MERTFVSKLLKHAKNGRFHPDKENTLAITDALAAVRKHHELKIDIRWGKYVVKFLRERHDAFGRLIARRDVVCNTTLRFVTAHDSTWKEFCKPVDSDSASVDNGSSESKEADSKDHFDPIVPIQLSDPVAIVHKDPCPYGSISDSPTSGSSLWNFHDDFYGFEDVADSMQPLPHVPSVGQKCEDTNCGSPSGVRSEGQASSSASNRTPVKKVD
ncbi:UNVERIFIED_CONTAM: hypothetical protein Sindi_1288000 [Sesamum indicum]